MRAAVVLSLVLPLGCAPTRPTQPAGSPEPSPLAPLSVTARSADAAPAEDPPVIPQRDDPDELLAPFALDSRSPARRILWSWTTEEQAAGFAKSRELVTKGREAAGDGNPFERALEAADDGSPFGASVARFVRTTLGKRRYAFANPLGWSVSPSGGSYGPVLVRMTLRDDAVILVLGATPTVGMEPFSALDVEGRAVRGVDLQAHPERIAVVFHTGFDGNADPFREYVVVNEAMLASWEIGTEAIEKERARAKEAIHRLLPLAEETSRHEPAEVAFAWQGAPRRPSVAAWHRMMGVVTARHEMTKAAIGRMEKQLGAAVRPPELVVIPERPKAKRLPPPPFRRPTPPLRPPPPEMTWDGLSPRASSG